ncbi:MAG: hypothetical protein ACKN89_06415 [Cyanobium sp.]
MKLPRYAAPGALGISVAALWALWPLLRPAFAPAPGTTLVVVFDGYHRLDAALERTSGPLLLLSCPRTGQPTAAQIRRAGSRPLFIDRSGQNSARQLTALAEWLARPPTTLPPFGRVLLVSDSHHIPRLLPAAHLALGSQGLAVSGLLANAHLPSSHRLAPPGPWPITRDWLRLQLWRATGSTGDFLLPEYRSRKQQQCG